MSVSQDDIERQARIVRDRVRTGVEDGLEMVAEHGGPLARRYGRTAIVIGVIGVTAMGVAIILARRHRRRPLTVRLQEALPDAVSARLEKPLSTIKVAAGRFTR
jgi:hypothetical protein